MENNEDLAVDEIIGFLRYLLACAGHDDPFDIKAHIPRVEKLIEDYNEAVSKENFNSISDGLADAIALATHPIDPSFKQRQELRLEVDRKLLTALQSATGGEE